jgi:hypothetical protein
VRDFVLTFRRQKTDEFDGFFHELSHA